MKKTLTVNLAGEVFHIDDDAYPVLERYIEALKSYHGMALLHDKEYKLASFFKSHLNGRSVITYADVEAACNAEGCPPGFNPRNPFAYQRGNSNGYNSSRRLYRDEQRKKIAGVCAGLGEYFDLDPMIIRLGFLIAFLAMGLVFYCILSCGLQLL